MTLPASALPVEAPPAFLGVAHSLTGKLWRDRLDARGAARALCAGIYRELLPASEQWLDRHAINENGPLPKPDAELAKRFANR